MIPLLILGIHSVPDEQSLVFLFFKLTDENAIKGRPGPSQCHPWRQQSQQWPTQMLLIADRRPYKRGTALDPQGNEQTTNRTASQRPRPSWNGWVSHDSIAASAFYMSHTLLGHKRFSETRTLLLHVPCIYFILGTALSGMQDTSLFRYTAVKGQLAVGRTHPPGSWHFWHHYSQSVCLPAFIPKVFFLSFVIIFKAKNTLSDTQIFTVKDQHTHTHTNQLGFNHFLFWI